MVVPGTQPKVPVKFEYADESDPGPYPIPRDAPIEGGEKSQGDRHILVIDRDHGRLYELFATRPPSGGKGWEAGSIPSRSGCEAGAGSAMLVRGAIAGARGLGFPAPNSLFQNIDDQFVD